MHSKADQLVHHGFRTGRNADITEKLSRGLLKTHMNTTIRTPATSQDDDKKKTEANLANAEDGIVCESDHFMCKKVS